MIVLKIILFVLLAVLGLVLAVLIIALALPVTAEVSFIGGKLKYKVKFAVISLMDSDGGGFLKKKKKKNKKPESEPEEEKDIYNTDEVYNVDVDDIEDTDDINIDIPVDEDIDLIIDEDESSDSDEKERSEKIRKIKEKKSVKNTPEESTDESENPLLAKIEFLVNIWDIAGRPLLKIFRGFHVKKVYMDFIVANEDAYKCAVNYGIVSGTVYNLLAWLGELFTVSYKTVDIRCGFSLKKSQWDASCKVDFRLYTLVVSILWFLIAYIFKILIPKKRGHKKSGK